MAWTDDEVDELIRLWNEGKSASDVAWEMHKMFGSKFTRNAIIGKVHRLLDAGKMFVRQKDAHLKRKPKEDRAEEVKRSAFFEKQKKMIAAKRTITKPIAAANLAPEIYGENVIVFPGRVAQDGPTTLVNVRGCLYAIGVNQRGQHMFCNAQKRDGSSYCHDHHAKCYLPTPKFDLKKVKKWRAF